MAPSNFFPKMIIGGKSSVLWQINFWTFEWMIVGWASLF
uniref:Uncharacterized protein n=1 Tax=Arundo donax TaxID=35708 RepID=A0A0A9HBA4_ARUDO